MVTKLNLRITSQVFSKNLRNQRTVRYQKKNYLHLLHNSTETSDVQTRHKNNKCWNYLNTCIIPAFFLHFKPYSTSFPELLLSLTLMSKGKKTLETSLDLTPLFKTFIQVKVEGLVLNVDYLENLHHNFIQKKYGRKTSSTHTCFALWSVIFLFVWNFYTFDDS